MNVLLANPPCRLKQPDGSERVFVRSGSRWPFSTEKQPGEPLDYVPFPFYPAYAGTLLKNSGFPVTVIDGVALNQNEEQFLAAAAAAKPDLIFFETTTPTVDYDLTLAQKLREATGAYIALGGPHATAFAADILSTNSHIDFVLVREYELTLLALAQALAEKRYAGAIPGLAFQGPRGIERNHAPLVEPLDVLPIPDRELLPGGRGSWLDLYWDGFCQNRPAAQMHASRGCPWRCNFCLWNQTMYANGPYRTFTAKRVVDEMEFLAQRYQVKEIYFDDDTFTARKRQVLAICDEIVGRGLNLNWSCMGDAMVTDGEMLARMAGAGCIGIKFGVESADPRILANIGKPLRLEKVRQVAAWAAKHGIKTHATFTLGLLGETSSSISRTLAFARSLDVDSVQFSATTPFPGTRYYDELKHNGLLRETDWKNFDGSHEFVTDLPDIPAAEINRACAAASSQWLKTKLTSPKWVLRQALNLRRAVKGQGARIVIERSRRAAELVLGGK